MKCKSAIRFSLSVLLVLAMCVCAPNLASAAAKKPQNIVVVQVVKFLTNPFFIECKWGGQAAANKYGVKYECLAPEKYSVENQIRVVEDLVQRGVDGIVLNPIDGKGIVAGIKQANKAGVPVMIVDTKAEGGDLLGFVTISNTELGRVIGRHVAETFGGKANIVIIEGTTGASSAQERHAGLMEEFAKAPGIKVMQSTTANWQRQDAMRVAEDMLVRYPDLDAIVCHNDIMALGAIEAVKEAKRMKQVVVFGMDAIPEAIDSILAGELAATVEGMGFQQAFAAVEMTCQYLLEGIVPAKGTIYLEDAPTAISARNVESWLEQRDKMFEAYGLKIPPELQVRRQK